ncbi:SDR family oxidoreductase, partial [uncultured Pseudomonas sp.]
MSILSAKVAVVIGGHGGIGGAIAERFATEGATVYASSRRTQARDVERGAGRLLERSLDASDVTALAAFFDRVRREAGRVDVLVVNAGLSEFAPLETLTAEHFDRTFALNVRALLFATQ